MGFIYTVTGFTPAYWNSWGVSFFASWKEFAGSAGRLILVHNGELPPLVEKKLLDEHVILIPASGTEPMRFQAWEAIANYNQDGTFVYFDGDVYFQKDLAPLFESAANKMVLCENLNCGMLGGPKRMWKFLSEFRQAAEQIQPGIQPQDLIGAFALHFPSYFSFQDNTWNFTSVPSLRLTEGQYGYRNEVVRVVHLSGGIKTFPEARKFFFHEKYPNLYAKWVAAFKGSSPRSFLKRVHHEVVKSDRI